MNSAAANGEPDGFLQGYCLRFLPQEVWFEVNRAERVHCITVGPRNVRSDSTKLSFLCQQYCSCAEIVTIHPVDHREDNLSSA